MSTLKDNYTELLWELNKTKELKDKFKARAKELKEIIKQKDTNFRRLNFEFDHYGKATILISKAGAIMQTINFNEETNPHGLRIDELKNVAQNLEQIYQDYESNIESTIILKSEWDETE